jgi:hypothetical protein
LRGVMLWTPRSETIFAERGRLAYAEATSNRARAGHRARARRRRQHVSFDVSDAPPTQAGPRARGPRSHPRPPARRARRPREPSSSRATGSLDSLELQRRFAYPIARSSSVPRRPLFLTRAHASRSAGSVMGLLCARLLRPGQLSEGSSGRHARHRPRGLAPN